MGTIRRLKDGVLMIDFRAGKGNSGKRFRERVDARTVAEARVILARRESEEFARHGINAHRRQRSVTLSSGFAAWSSSRSRDETTRVRRFIDFVGDRDASEVTSADLIDFRNARLTSVGPTTVRREFSALSSFFTSLVDDKAISANPCRDVRRPAGRSRSPNALCLEAQCTILDVTASHALLGPFFMVAFYTAMRREEITKLSWSHLDFSARWGDDPAQVGVINPPGTKTKHSKDPIPMIPILRRYLESLPRVGPAVVSGKSKTHVLPNAINQAVNSWNRRFAAGERPFALPNPHRCRHTCATLLLASGVDMLAVSKFLRHASTRVTSETYDQTRALDFGKAIHSGMQA